MTELTCKALVIGGGPGGYVAGIRAGQLGLDTIVVDAEALGGTCLNVGCIPSKAVIHAADEFEKATHFANSSALGISAGKPKLDLSKTVAWKDGIVKRLTTGVGGLLKKNKVRTIKGWATFIDGKTVDVKTADGVQRIRAENVIIATGSIRLSFRSWRSAAMSFHRRARWRSTRRRKTSPLSAPAISVLNSGSLSPNSVRK